MGKETNFDPDILEHAYNELAQLAHFLTHDPALKRLQSSSTIAGDMTGLDDSNGGWGWLEQHVNDIAGYVGQITSDIQQESAALQTRMRTSIDHLKGADDANKSGLNQTRSNIDSGSTGGGRDS